MGKKGSKKNQVVEDIIIARGLVKTYDTGKLKVEALRGIDLVIKKGDMVSIMGPSGCGKTTMLNCLSGLDDVTEGDIYIEGKHLNTLNDNAKTEHRALRMGFIFQFYNLLPVLTAVENVELPLLVAGIKPKEARKQALEALDLVALTRWKEHMPSELSGGQRQRVTIARALVNKPAIVFADEPTGDLDRKTSDDVMKLLEKLNREENQTFVIVSHDPRVGNRARRKIIMGDGVIDTDSDAEYVAKEE